MFHPWGNWKVGLHLNVVPAYTTWVGSRWPASVLASTMVIWRLSSMPGVRTWMPPVESRGPIACGHKVHPSLINVHDHAHWDIVLLHNGLIGLEVGIFHGAQHLWRGRFLPSLVPFLLVHPMWHRRDSAQALVRLTWPPCSARSPGVRCPTMLLAVTMTVVWLTTLPASPRAFRWLQTWSSST